MWTVVDGTFNGVWAKTMVGKGTTFANADVTATGRIRFGGCKTDGTSCGTKVAGEEYEYTYVLTLAQGS